MQDCYFYDVSGLLWIFAWAAATFGSSRPAVLSLIVFFLVGGYLLTRVDIDAGKKVAQMEDAALLQGSD